MNCAMPHITLELQLDEAEALYRVARRARDQNPKADPERLLLDSLLRLLCTVMIQLAKHQAPPLVWDPEEGMWIREERPEP